MYKKIVMFFGIWLSLSIATLSSAAVADVLHADRSKQKMVAHTMVAENSEQEGGSEAANNEEEGKFTFEVVKQDEYSDLYDLVKEDGTFEKTVEQLNKIFKLPTTLHVYFDKSEDGSSYYQSSQKKLVLSYYRLKQVMDLYKKDNPNESEEDVKEYGINVMRFIFFHELGHALIDVYHLPIVGDEETSADNLAAVIALEFTPSGWDITVSAADFFDLLRKSYEDEEHESSYWDEHRLDGQRYYYILCLTYGKFPEETKKELASYNDEDLNKFITERGATCRYTYNDSLSKWVQALSPHLKMSPDDIKKELAKDSDE